MVKIKIMDTGPFIYYSTICIYVFFNIKMKTKKLPLYLVIPTILLKTITINPGNIYDNGTKLNFKERYDYIPFFFFKLKYS